MHKYLFLPPCRHPACAVCERRQEERRKSPRRSPEKKAPVRLGLFGVSHEKDDWFVVVPDSLLGRPLLVTTRYVATPAGAGVYGGELANRQGE